MNFLGLLLVLALVAGPLLASTIHENDGQLQHSRQKRSLDDKFYAFLVKFKNTLREGKASMNLPPMDPYANEKLDLVINETIAQGTAQFRELGAVGLAGYDIDKASINLFPPSITVGLTWPQLFAESDYSFKVLALDKYDAFGDGHIICTANDLAFETTMKVSMVGGFKVKSMKTSISLGGLKFKITGLFNDEQISEMISISMSDIAPQMIEIYQNEITAVVNEKATVFINSQLEGKTLQDLIDLIGG